MYHNNNYTENLFKIGEILSKTAVKRFSYPIRISHESHVAYFERGPSMSYILLNKINGNKNNLMT